MKFEVVILGATCCLSLLLHSSATTSPALALEHIFVQGAPLVGGTNGMFFDNDNHLVVAQVYGRAISRLDADTGEVIETLGFDDGVAFPDDVTVDSNGTLYWSDTFYFETIMARSANEGGPAQPLLPVGSVPFANPVTLSTDETRLFFAQCWNPEPANGVYELNLETNTLTALLEGIPGCASNGMDYKDDDMLYLPLPFEGRIVMLDLSANDTASSIANVTTGWGGVPNALKFDSKGNLYALNTGIGEVARIDIDDDDTENNRQVVAEYPPGSIDNLAFDKDDRLFVSSTSDGTVTEVMISNNNEQRIVSGGQFSIPLGAAYLQGIIYTLHPGALFGFDMKTGERKHVVRSLPGGAGPLHEPTGLITWGNDLVLLSFPFGALDIYDPVNETIKLTTYFDGPIDAHPFQNDLLVTEANTGNVVRASGADLGQRQVLTTFADAGFLAGDDNDVYLTGYLTDTDSETLYQIISNGEVLVDPIVVATGFITPEGIVLLPGGETIVLVDSGKESLEAIDLTTGEVKTIATELSFLPGIPGLEYGFGNDVEVDDEGAIYVNGDRANVIYKFPNTTYIDDSDDSTSSVSPTSIYEWSMEVVTVSLILFLVYTEV